VGDPAEVAAPSARVPRDAIAAWEDDLAAQGPVVNGRAALRLGDRGALLVDIVHQGQTLTFRTDAAPYVATGFVPERIPGMPRSATPLAVARALDALLATSRQRADLAPDAQVALARAQAALAAAPMVTHRDAAQLAAQLTAIDRSGALAAALGDAPAYRDALALGAAVSHWEALAAGDPGGLRVLLGDRANLGREQAHYAHNWVIAGTGGTAVSAAEILLDENRKARVTLVGADTPAGLLENDQFMALARRHADADLARQLGLVSCHRGSDGFTQLS
jgi:hypothetical protein